MDRQLTPRQVARALGVSEASLKRWCDRGLIENVRTEGGHRRLSFSAVMRFVRDRGRELSEPEVLGLPSAVRRGPRVVARAARTATAALLDGDFERLRGVVYSLYLAGHGIAEIGDEVLADAFAVVGERWRHGELAIFEERRGCEMVTRLLHELVLAIPAPAAEAPLAIGGTLSGDPYMVPNTLVDVALRDLGWRVANLGTGLPIETIAQAVTALKPRLLWLCLSTPIADEAPHVGGGELMATAAAANTQVIVGGRAATAHDLALLPGAVGVAMLRGLPSPPQAGVAQTGQGRIPSR